jgi:hypothetical protein
MIKFPYIFFQIVSLHPYAIFDQTHAKIFTNLPVIW